MANQQAQSYFIGRDELKNVTYEEEAMRIKAKLSDGQELTVNELYFLTHAEIMTQLEKWADTKNIPFVNIIEALNNDRDQLTSWVHLSPKGNQIIASKFAEKILQYTCPESE